MDSKQILKLNKRQSIIQRIDSMKSSLCASKIKDKLSRFHYFGYPNQIPNLLIDKIPSNINHNSKIAIANDFGLEIISKLIELGYSNLYVLCTEENDKLYSIIEYMIEKEFNFSRDRIVRLTNIDMNDKFDLVIANPPYEIGNAVITETMRHCNEAVVLMPLRSYRSSKLYKKIKSIDIVDQRLFTNSGAAVQQGLAINLLSNLDNDKSWEELELESFNKSFRLVYEWNVFNSNKRSFKETLSYDSKPEDFNPEVDFLYSVKIVSSYNGVYFGGLDYAYNTGKDYSSKWISSIVCLHFDDKQSKSNFTDWWYSNKEQKGLTTKLLWGMNKSSCPLISAIPVIDWSKTDVEYTDEYVLSQMGLKWNENKDGVEIL